MASGTTYVIVTVNSQATANEINENDSHEVFANFTKKLFLKQKKVFAITQEQSQRVTGLFRSHMQSGTLPEPITFAVSEDEQVEKEPTKEEIIMDLFGKDNVMITED